MVKPQTGNRGRAAEPIEQSEAIARVCARGVSFGHRRWKEGNSIEPTEADEICAAVLVLIERCRMKL